ncbi:MAG: formylglycine-generating enzyme family protein, partial [Dysgonamonadaceae bacterium]|nr:formylglycine-generating enzyme family protein [Dysgonamonadaceae bacterium]
GEHVLNISRKCVFKWDGTKWIDLCLAEKDLESFSFGNTACFSTGVTSDDNLKFTAKADPNAEAYEFLASGSSKGVHSDNSITFAEAKTDVTVKYYYPTDFLKPKMIDVAGSSSWKYGSENSSTNVTIADFKMGETEVTQAQFEYVMGENPSDFRCGGNDNAKTYANKGNATSDLPVETVNWYHAIAYCNKLSIREGKQPCYAVYGISAWVELDYGNIPTSDNSDWNAATCDFSKDGYRLPTESEWEYAARGGKNPTTTYLYAGAGSGNNADNAALCTVAWFSGNNETNTTCNGTASDIYGAKPVKKKTANDLGLHDMSGNVYEWTWSGNSDAFPAATPSNAVQVSGLNRVYRGGNWNVNESSCRVSYGSHSSKHYRNDKIGFRVACKGD